MVCVFMASAWMGIAIGGEFGQHYYSLTKGLKVGSLNTPGFTFNVNVPYQYSNKWYDKNGNGRYYKREIVYVEPELTWSSQNPLIFNARYEATVALPVLGHVEDSARSDTLGHRNHVTNKTGDLRLTPIRLGWEFCRFDLSAGYTLFAPVGDFKIYKNPSFPDRAAAPNAGKGYWTSMLSFGGTYYFDDAKSWSLSLQANYEFHHGRQDETHVQFGDNFHFEYGIGKEFCSGWRVGVVGYGSIQTTRNKTARNTPGDYRYLSGGSGNRVFGTGFEVGYQSHSRIPWFITARGVAEYAARGSLRGYRTMYSLGVRF